jgi:hypothetical protein
VALEFKTETPYLRPQNAGFLCEALPLLLLMQVTTTSFCATPSRAAARATVVCLMVNGKKCKRVASLNAGLLMVKKSKKRNPT